MLAFFDLDGTLLDMSERWYRLHVDIATLYKLNILPKDTYIALKREAVSERDILSVGALPDPQALEAYCKERQILIENDEYLLFDQPVAHAHDVLSAWKERYGLVLVTKRSRADALMVQLERLRLREYFCKVLVGADKHAELTRAYTDAEVRDAPFISDAYEDFETARVLAMRPIMVGYGARSTTYFQKQGLDSIIEEPISLISLLEKK